MHTVSQQCVSRLREVVEKCRGPSTQKNPAQRGGQVSPIPLLPLVIHQVLEARVVKGQGILRPRPIEPIAHLVASAQRVPTRERHDVAVIEAHAAKHLAQMCGALQCVGKATVLGHFMGRASAWLRVVAVRTAKGKRDLRAVNSMLRAPASAPRRLDACPSLASTYQSSW